jgi:GNAT superfamily N-acetyltransferase
MAAQTDSVKVRRRRLAGAGAALTAGVGASGLLGAACGVGGGGTAAVPAGPVRLSLMPVKATEVRGIFVKAPFRGQGIGRRLMAAFLRWSGEQQAHAVELGVFFSNARARAFYDRLGFAPTLVTMERVLPTEP